jgi:hypothetical protein
MQNSKGTKKHRKTSTTTKPAKPTSGQSAPPIKLTADDLNDNETTVVQTLASMAAHSKRARIETKGVHLSALAELCFASVKDEGKRNSWVRNSMRRLICGGLAVKLAPGLYDITTKGSKAIGGAE